MSANGKVLIENFTTGYCQGHLHEHRRLNKALEPCSNIIGIASPV